MSVTKLEDNNEFEPIVNKVAQSGLITINLEDYIPSEILALDVKDFLFKELLLKEKDFKQKIEEYDWSVYKNKIVAIHCSNDALVQQWAYMMLVRELSSVTKQVYFGNVKEVQQKLLVLAVLNLDVEEYKDERVIVKGCGHQGVSDEAYGTITQRLLPVVKSLMYGEACSNVPIYKQKK